ncbi:hypothetical protein BELL_0229g00030 [Botrytis elliptica]|uniref:Uncharacterized protein n=1 Tax=Botrytis elliptica TaxID=278938 RepID=A0A4Z1JU99_9HELO|nr:hypothetical protein BELL_0229g00030 [Botrytis elliptica]
MSPRNDEIPSTIHGLVADSGNAIRAMNREQNSDLDTNFGRFVLRYTAELTNADIAALSSGVNDLIILAQREAGLNREDFLNSSAGTKRGLKKEFVRGRLAGKEKRG